MDTQTTTVEIKTVSEQIYSLIKAEIIHHELVAGQKLTTKFLQTRFGVSSSPIREALTRLQEDGLIDYQPNVGMRVKSFTEKDVDEIYTLVAELDLIAVRFACQSNKRDQLIQDLRKLQDDAAGLLQKGDIDAWKRLSAAFHAVFFLYADNQRLSDAAEKYHAQMAVFANSYENEPEAREEIQQEHEQVMLCLETGNDRNAIYKMRRHLSSSKRKALSVVASGEM